MFFMFCNGPFAWSSQRKSMVSLLTCESEFYGITIIAKEAMHLTRLFHEMNTFESFQDEAEEQIDFFVMKPKSQDGSSEERIKILCDNQSAIKVAKDERVNKRAMKHVRVRENFMRDLISKEIIQVQWIRTKLQVADIYTKTLQKATFNHMRKLIGLRFKREANAQREC
jgi:hypothetical protein